MYRANLSRRLVLVVAPCSTVAATAGRVRKFRAADTGRKDVSSVRARRSMGRSWIRILNVLAMLFAIRSVKASQKTPDGPIGTDVHIHAVG